MRIQAAEMWTVKGFHCCCSRSSQGHRDLLQGNLLDGFQEVFLHPTTFFFRSELVFGQGLQGEQARTAQT